YCSADKAGTFFGYKTAGNLTFTDCFTTGRCEGTQDVGGFYAGADGSGTVNFTRCYTTAQVGVLTAGANLGGFIGNTANSTYRFADCYAAGEVGSLKTLPSQTGTQGGFSGDYKSGLVFTNCYYDKQTSAMREKGFGGNSYTQSTQPTTTLVGILTTGADGQTGLTEAPGTAGFKGFSSNNSGWRYRSGSYPQLTAFSDGDSALWGEDANLVQANSLASVTTIYLDTWNSGYNNRTLPTTVYDTVRDITVRFPMATMDNLTWALGVYTRLSDGSLGYRPAQTIIGSGAGAAFKRTLSVVTLGQLGGKNYVVDSAPGVEWVNALVTQGDQTARREIRLVPTCTLSPGADVVQSIGSTYDHRGVPSITTPVLTYSTAPILDTNGAMDPNTGEFDPAKAVYTFDNTYNKATNSSTRLNYADGASPLTSHRIHALLAKLAPDTLTAGTVITSSTLQGWIQNPVDNGSYLALDKKWTAQTPFVKGEDGYYYMDYVWELSDGRFIRNGKIISLKDNTHQVSITVVNTDGTPNAEAALIGASATGSSLSSTPFSNTQATFNDGTPVYLSYRLVPGSDGLPRYAVTNLSLSSGSTTTGWTTASPVESPDGTHYQLTKAAYDLFKSPDGSGYVVEKGSILRDYLLATLSGGTKVLTLNCNATQPLDNGEVLSYKDLAEDAKLQITVARVYNTFFIDPIRATPQNPYVSINSGILSGNSVGAAPAQNPGATVNAQGNYLEFKEWNTKADGTGTPYAPEQTIQNSDAKYYAVYRPLAMSLQKRLDGSTTEGGTRLSTDIGKPVGVSLALTMERPSAGLTALDITDTADAGLSLLPNTLDIYSGTNAQGTRLTQGVDYTQSLDKGTLTIHFSSDFLAQTTPWNPNFYIHYTMVPTADALLGQQGNQNTAALNYHAGDGLTSTIKAPPCVLYTYGLTIEKLGEGAALLSSTQLAGVRFTLTRADGTVLEFKPIVSGAYTGSMIPQTGGSPVLETNAQGKITLRGIGPGTYYLTETQTLPGYQLLKRPVLLVITTVDGSTGKVQATVDGRTASLANDGSSTSAILPMTIKNYPGFALPASGSFSLLGAIIAGSVLLGASALFTLRYWRH
ncbi:MAG: SpaA isopeptide-forming pilin-related protein, partial [Eubacterium sp.]